MKSRLLTVLLALAALPLVAGCDPAASDIYTARGTLPNPPAPLGPAAPSPVADGGTGGSQGGKVPDGPVTPGPGVDAGVPGDAGSPTSDGGANTAASDEAYCVELINQYRTQVGKGPLRVSPELEASSTAAAEADSRTGIPHGNFSFGGGGGASAENEIPGWPLETTVRDVVRGGLQMMWEEGPGGGHYENMIGDYSEAGCGIHVARGNSVWSAQRFR